jgi:hypothetical protein
MCAWARERVAPWLCRTPSAAAARRSDAAPGRRRGRRSRPRSGPASRPSGRGWLGRTGGSTTAPPRSRPASTPTGPIEHSPGYGALAGALARHLSPQAGEGIRSIFSAWDVAGLRALLTGAGCGDVRIRIRIDTLRYPSAADFLRLEAAGSPLAGPVAAMPVGDRDALVAELAEELADHTDDDGVVLALESFAVLARRW